MKNLKSYGAGLLVALSLALVVGSASGQGAGSSGKGSSGTTVTVQQYGSGASVVYYRVGSGNWRHLTLSAGRGTFTANGEYEVAARCDSVNTLSLFKVSTTYLTMVPFTCPPGPMVRNVSFDIALPSSVGGVSPQSGDLVVVGPQFEAYEETDSVTVDTEGLLASAGGIVIMLIRPSSSDSVVSYTPYAYKVVSLGADDTSVPVDSKGWEAISPTNTRSLSASVPEGFTGTALVFHTRNGYLGMVTLGGANLESGASATSKYGLLPWSGVYVGYYEATSSESPNDTLKVFQDTGGGNWKPTVPAPWASGQFAVKGGTLIFSRKDARAFTAEFSGLAQLSGGVPLNIEVFVQAAPDGNTTYRIPVVPDLDYKLIDNPSAVNFSIRALIRDRNIEFLYGFAPPSEALARGVDLVIAEREGAFFGSEYTLP